MKKYVNIQLEEKTLEDLDIIAGKVTRKRKQVIELLLEKLVKKKIEEKDFSL